MMKFNTVVGLLLAISVIASPALCASSEEAKTAIDGARADIERLAEKGISTFAVNDLLKEAELQYSRGEYDRSAEVAAEISGLVESALHADQLMEQAEPMVVELEKQGTDTKGMHTAFSKASEAFLRDDFKAAEEYAQETMDRITDAQSKAGVQKALFEAEGRAAVEFVQKYWIAILAVCAVSAYAGSRFWKRHEKGARKSSVAGLKAKRKSILKLMKEMQTKHFVEGEISKKEYQISMRNYRERLADIKRRLKMVRRG